MEALLTAKEMAEIDRKTIEELGIPGAVLMENAGRETARLIVDLLEDEAPEIDDIPVTVVSGMGNNGGDGFVIARHLSEEGFDVTCFLVGQKEMVKGDAKVYLDVLEKTGTEVLEVRGNQEMSILEGALQESYLIIDALFGTGLSKELGGIFPHIVDMINESESIVLSVDMPSGIDATLGNVRGSAVNADVTCTFGFMKLGQKVLPGCEYCGDLYIVDIGIPAKALEGSSPEHFLITGDWVSSSLPQRPLSSHKGSAGKVYVIGGSPGMTGALVMACEGALAAGSGLIYGVVPESLNPIFEIKLTEELTLPVPDDGKGFFNSSMANAVKENIAKADALAIGPGMSWNIDTEGFIKELLPDIACPFVIDADGLNCLSSHLDTLSGSGHECVLTPHEMEMSRLTGLDIEEVKGNRISVAKNFSREHGLVTVLKGYMTVIASPSGMVCVNETGNPYMATGGAGDVLTGLIVSFMGQGMEPFEASVLAVYLHGLCADISQERYPGVPVAPRHLISYYPEALLRVMGQEEERD